MYDANIYKRANRDTVNRLFGLGLYDMIPYEDLELEAPKGENPEHVATFDSNFPHEKAMELLLEDPKYVHQSISGFDSDAAPDRFDLYEEDSHRNCPEYDHDVRFQTTLGDPIGGILLFAALFKKHIRPEHVSTPFFATGALHEGNQTLLVRSGDYRWPGVLATERAYNGTMHVCGANDAGSGSAGAPAPPRLLGRWHLYGSRRLGSSGAGSWRFLTCAYAR